MEKKLQNSEKKASDAETVIQQQAQKLRAAAEKELSYAQQLEETKALQRKMASFQAQTQ